jgi:RimJ/RimL family protein N-acetyltransferase
MTRSGRHLLQYLKASDSSSGSVMRLPIHEFNDYSLRPIPTKHQHQDIEDVRCLTIWRNKYPRSFLTEFLATEQRTARWLAEVVHKDDNRILFMIENAKRERVGYMGIAYIDWDSFYGEPDAIVSNGATPKGLMNTALRALLEWARRDLNLKNIVVRVLSDNPALLFYKGLGFEETHRIPLKQVASNDLISWVEDATLSISQRYLVYHSWGKNEN